MYFEYFNRDGDRTLYTESAKCVLDDYEKDNLKAMKENGYKFKINGKAVSYKKLVEIITDNTKSGSWASIFNGIA